MEYSTDLEEGEIRESAPAPIVGSPHVVDWDPRGASETSYGNNDDNSYLIRSSRSCTPPGLTMSRFARAASTPCPRPSPSSRAHWQTRMPESPPPAASDATRLSLVAGLGRDQYPGHDRAPGDAREGPWAIPPDVYREAENALARVATLSTRKPCYSPRRSGGGEGMGARACYDQRLLPEQAPMAGPQPTSARLVLEAYHREPPQSPLSPEELRRAIGIIEDLFLVNGVPPYVFIQCGISPGTLYHAFNHLGLKLPDDLW
ncbi:hypothetical protein AX15_005572 [Amanita polypyramis BW_CC]|nr:hypothetical protein AX15_005572 [Amanita polypyramis BW_CC]